MTLQEEAEAMRILHSEMAQPHPATKFIQKSDEYGLPPGMTRPQHDEEGREKLKLVLTDADKKYWAVRMQYQDWDAYDQNKKMRLLKDGWARPSMMASILELIEAILRNKRVFVEGVTSSGKPHTTLTVLELLARFGILGSRQWGKAIVTGNNVEQVEQSARILKKIDLTLPLEERGMWYFCLTGGKTQNTNLDFKKVRVIVCT